jgi:hypothetical protein
MITQFRSRMRYHGLREAVIFPCKSYRQGQSPFEGEGHGRDGRYQPLPAEACRLAVSLSDASQSLFAL